MAEEFEGIKFDVEIVDSTVPQHPGIGELIHWAYIMSQKGLVPSYQGGASGNLSFRLPRNQFIITASGVRLDKNMSNEEFVHVMSVKPDKKRITMKGKREPSSESMLHAMIYACRTDVNCIMHGHGGIVLQNAEKLKIPVTPIEFPYGTVELANMAAAFAGTADFFVLRNHGFIALGTTVKLTGQLMLETISQLEKL